MGRVQRASSPNLHFWRAELMFLTCGLPHFGPLGQLLIFLKKLNNFIIIF